MPAFRPPSFLNHALGSVDLDLLRDFCCRSRTTSPRGNSPIAADTNFDEERTRMVNSFPTNETLWQRYAEIRAEGLRNGDGGTAGTKFYRGKRLGKDDHIVTWRKPTMRNIDRVTYKSMPKQLTVREAHVHVHQPGFRTKVFIVVTTLLDPEQYSKEDLAERYRERWHNEVFQAGYIARSLLYLDAA